MKQSSKKQSKDPLEVISINLFTPKNKLKSYEKRTIHTKRSTPSKPFPN